MQRYELVVASAVLTTNFEATIEVRFIVVDEFGTCA